MQKHTDASLSPPAQRGFVCTIPRLQFALAVLFYSPTHIDIYIYMITQCLVVIEVKHKVSDSRLQIKEEAIMMDREEALFI